MVRIFPAARSAGCRQEKSPGRVGDKAQTHNLTIGAIFIDIAILIVKGSYKEGSEKSRQRKD